MTTPDDTPEPSPASAGSHGKVTVSVHKDDSACAFPDSRPIRRQRFTLTDAEREAVAFALKSLDWPLDGPQLAVVARTLGPSCEVPEHRMKATLRGLLERTR
jgi:hypothetical protein